MATRLADEHGDDGSGHCRSCSSGAQTGRYTHPCYILLAVQEAMRRLAEEGARRRGAVPEPMVQA